jgi:hypothetical protein
MTQNAIYQASCVSAPSHDHHGGPIPLAPRHRHRLELRSLALRLFMTTLSQLLPLHTPVIYFSSIAWQTIFPPARGWSGSGTGSSRVNMSSPLYTGRLPTLPTVAITLAGAVAFRALPVSPLPQARFSTISVAASLLRRKSKHGRDSGNPLNSLAGLHRSPEMTSSSSRSANNTLQFDLNRNMDAAARDVQAAINAARATCRQSP